MINLSDVIPAGSNVNEILAKCPKCKSDKYKLAVNLTKNVFQCFLCGFTGTIGKKDQFYQRPEDLLDIKEQIENLFIVKKKIKIDLNKISWPLSEEITPIAYNYMINRRFSPEDFKTYNLRVGKEFYDKAFFNKKWCGRVLFPYFDASHDCTYVVGRSYAGKTPKYLNSIGDKNSVVYGIDLVDGKCILCEGIISAITATKVTKIPAVSILGKFASNHQLNLLRSKADKIYLSLDGDVEIETKKKLIDKLISFNFSVWNIDLPQNKDPDDLGEDYIEFFNKATKVSLF